MPEKLEQPLHWRRPRTIFVNSMSDLFHEDVPADVIAGVGDVMGRANWHVFQVLTKRDERMRELLSGSLRWMADLQNVAYGVSVEDRRYGTATDLLVSSSVKAEGADRSGDPPQGSPGGNWSARPQIRADLYYAAHLLGDLKDLRTRSIVCAALRALRRASSQRRSELNSSV